MTIIDILIVTILIYNITSGMRKTVVKNVAECVAIVLGVLLGVAYDQTLAIKTAPLIRQSAEIIIPWMFLLIWIVTFLIVIWLGERIEQANQKKETEHQELWGIVLGILKGILLLIPFLMLMNLNQDKLYQKAILAKPLTKMVEGLCKNSGLQSLFQPKTVESIELSVPDIRDFNEAVENRIPEPITQIKQQSQNTEIPDNIKKMLKKNDIDTDELKKMLQEATKK